VLAHRSQTEHHGQLQVVSKPFPVHSVQANTTPRITETQCFMFLIGEEQTPFQIHTGALSNLSPMMAAMIEGV
jgi:hypothetical protein